MRIRWRNLELPNVVVLDEESATATYGRFTVEPFERGFGTTVGNSLRRILLSSLEGAAVTRVRIKGARHEFSSLPGVREDVTEIILNIKNLVVQIAPHVDEPKKLRVSRSAPGPITGGDLQGDPSVEIRNKNLVIAELTDKVDFELELEVRKGRGYTTALDNINEEMEAGTIPVDSVFSPVTRVRYATEDTRVGQKTNFDRLVIEVWTNGTVSPEMALVEAAKILRKHLNPFLAYGEQGRPFEAAESSSSQSGSVAGGDLPPEIEAKLALTVQQLELSVRATNCLESAGVDTVRQLVVKSEEDLLGIRSFGRTSLREVVRKLEGLGFKLGTNLNDLRVVAAAPAAENA